MKTWLTLLLLSCATAATPQEVQEQAGIQGFRGMPGQPPAPAIGTGSIAGTVVNAITRAPIAGATASLNGPNIQLNATSDTAGTFVFRALPAGAYFASAQHPGFFFSPRGGGAPQQLSLVDGEEKRGTEVALTPGASISGQVLDEDSAPVAFCMVQAYRVDGRRLQQESAANTDDRGVYRVTSLQKGRYHLNVQCSESFLAPRGFMRPNDPSVPMEGYAPAKYGADATGSPASSIAVGAGSEITGIDFHVKRVRLYALRCVLAGGDPTVLQATNLTLRASGSDPGEIVAGANMDPATGRFLFQRVPAGSYELEAFTMQPEDRAWNAHQTVEVGKTEITEVRLQIAQVPGLSGSIATDDPTVSFEGWQMQLVPNDNDYRMGAPALKISKDGTFQIASVLPGRYRLNPPPSGYIKSVTFAGREMSPEDIDIAGAGALHISLGSKMAKLTAEVAAQAGNSALVLLLPEGAGGGWDGRYTATPDPQGHILFSQIAPGKYRVFALQYPNPWALLNSAPIRRALEARGSAVELAEGDEKHATVPVIPTEDVDKLLEQVE